MEERKHIVILAAGDFPTHEIPLKALREADFIVFCDSAYRQYPTVNDLWAEEKPFAVIGDGDSLSPYDKRQLGDRWIQVDEQDYNDLHKAMEWAASTFHLSPFTFHLLGATGKREDHTLGNISYLATFIREHPGVQVEMLTDHGRFTAFTGRRTYDSFPRQQVSLFSMTPEVPVSTTGLQWEIKGRCLPVWWEGTLNSALTDSFTVEGGTMIVFQTYEPKEA